jgi:hypothetical protein
MTMKFNAILLALAMVLSSGGSALAHPEHEHEHRAPRAALSEDAAKARAKEEVARLISVSKVDGSWKDVAIKGIEKRTHKDSWEWVATFENATAKKDKVLYVFLTPQGDFVAANFTGK